MTAKHITAPDGSLWQLVPVELPKEMLKARNSGDWPSLMTEEAVGLWSAWLAAAPEFGGVAEPALTPTFEQVWAKLQPVERAIISAQFMEPSRWNPHPPAADEAMGRDAAMLDWLVREFEKHGAIDVRRYGPGKAGCLLFTVSSQHVRGLGLRAAIDAAMQSDTAGKEDA